MDSAADSTSLSIVMRCDRSLGWASPETSPVGGRWRAAVPALSRLLAAALCIGASISSMACRSLGPDTVSSGGFDYSHALSESWKRTMLLNLVKTRYVDAPIFLDVTSVINQYEMTSNVDLGSAIVSGSLNDTLSLGARRSYSDRPTITYSPMTGERFTRSIMTPIPVHSLLYLIQSGVDVDNSLAIGARSINGIENRVTTEMGGRAVDPRFVELLGCLRRLQSSGHLNISAKSAENSFEMLLRLRRDVTAGDVSPTVEADIERVRSLLQLDPAVDEFPVVYGSERVSGREISLFPRSMMMIMSEFASWVRVPEKEIAEGRVRPTATPGDGPMGALICVHCGVKPPTDAFVSVPYRNQWYWIDDRDIRSKRALAFLMLFLSLTDAPRANEPLVTIPAN